MANKFLAVHGGIYGYGATAAAAEAAMKSNGGDVNLATVYSVPDTHQMVSPNPATNTKAALSVTSSLAGLTVVSKPKNSR